MRRFFITVSAIVIALSAFSLWFLYLALQESLYFHKGTVEYYLLIPDEIKEMPLMGGGEPEYFSSAGDGPKQPKTAVIYSSNLDKKEIIGRYWEYFGAQGGEMEIQENDDAFFWFSNRTKVFELSVEPDDQAGNQVFLSLME